MNLKKLNQKIKDKTAIISIIGLGYVGLPTAVFFAQIGFKIIGVDIDKNKINSINNGNSPIKELNLDEKLKKVVELGKLTATTNFKQSIPKADFILIIVPTPTKQSKDPDLSYIENASRMIGKYLGKNQIVILESTVYPGVTEEVVIPILEQESKLKSDIDFGVAYVPERYNPGDAKYTIKKVSRIVGAENKAIAETVKNLYQNIIGKKVIIVKDIKTAEASKVIENIQRDLNIALMNELALIFERMNIDVMDVIKAASSKWNFIRYYPGAGVGGHCLPHDPYYLTKKAHELGYIPRIILAGRAVNDNMPHYIFNLLCSGLNKCEKSVKNSNIVILGASYKGNTGDLRSAPAEIVIEDLRKEEAKITIVEPYIKEDTIFGCKNIYSIDAIDKNIDVILLITDHEEFKNMDLEKLRKRLIKKDVLFVDGRRIYRPNEVREHFIYYGVGVR